MLSQRSRKCAQIRVGHGQCTYTSSTQANELFTHNDGENRPERSDDGGTTDGGEDPPTSDFDDSAPSAILSAASVDEDDNVEPLHRKRKRDRSIDPSNARNVNRKFHKTYTKSDKQKLMDDIEGPHLNDTSGVPTPTAHTDTKVNTNSVVSLAKGRYRPGTS